MPERSARGCRELAGLTLPSLACCGKEREEAAVDVCKCPIVAVGARPVPCPPRRPWEPILADQLLTADAGGLQWPELLFVSAVDNPRCFLRDCASWSAEHFREASAYSDVEHSEVTERGVCPFNATLHGHVELGRMYMTPPAGIDADWAHTTGIDSDFVQHVSLFPLGGQQAIVVEFTDYLSEDPDIARDAWQIVASLRFRNRP